MVKSERQMNIVLEEEAYAFLREVPPFQFLDEVVLREIAGNVTMNLYKKGTFILKQDGPPSDDLVIIKKGTVQVTVRAQNGSDLVIDHRSEGDSFGLIPLISKDRQRTTIVAIEDTICYLLAKEIVRRLVESQPLFTEYFFQSYFEKYIDKTYRERYSRGLFNGSSNHFLFTCLVGTVATRGIITVNKDESIRVSAQKMVEHRISSLVVLNGDGHPEGIVTDRDLRGKVVAKGQNVDRPVSDIMSLPLVMVETRDYCFEALLRMIKHNVHHILVMEEGRLKGVLTNHDLMMLQGSSPVSFAKDLESRDTIEELAQVSAKTSRVVRLLVKEGARGSNITKIITELNDRLVRRVLELAERKFGSPPVPYCWIVFGSEGRKEQTFKTDQDNAIIYSDPATSEQGAAAEKYFADFATHVQEALVKCGFPACTAGFMASNPEWCQPLSAWKHYFSRWISNPRPESVLKSLIFFDFRHLYADPALARELRQHLQQRLKDNYLFFAQMASLILKNRPPLGFFNSFIVEKDGDHKNELNLKIRGTGPLVDIVRLMALEAGVTETSTLDRIDAMKGKHPAIDEVGDELAQAFEFITQLRIRHQAEQLEGGKSLDNFINPGRMTSLEKRSLRAAFLAIARVQDNIMDLYGPGLVGG